METNYISQTYISQNNTILRVNIQLRVVIIIIYRMLIFDCKIVGNFTYPFPTYPFTYLLL